MNARGPHANSRGPRAVLLGGVRGGLRPGSSVCGGAGCGGMRHPALRTPVWSRASRLARSRKFIRRGGIYCARRRVSEANRRAAAALRPEIPPVEPCAAVGSPGRYGIGPYRRQGNAHSRPRAFAAPQACGTMRASSPTVSTAFSFAARRQRLRRGKAGRYGIGPYGLNGFLGPGFASAGGPYTPAGRVVSSRGAPPARSSAVRGWGAAGAAPRFSRATASISLMRFSWLTRVALGS